MRGALSRFVNVAVHFQELMDIQQCTVKIGSSCNVGPLKPTSSIDDVPIRDQCLLTDVKHETTVALNVDRNEEDAVMNTIKEWC